MNKVTNSEQQTGGERDLNLTEILPSQQRPPRNEPAPEGIRGYWTLGVLAVVQLLNLAVFGATPETQPRLEQLQFDGLAVRAGEWWRLFTGNFVHWNPTHFYLDIGLFLVVGLLYERAIGRVYPLFLFFLCFAVGLGILWFSPERTLCRGLSGVNSGLLAAALVIEVRQSIPNPRRWLWVGPATGLFVFKIIYEGTTGRAFFGADALTGSMKLSAAAHVSGAIAGFSFAMLHRYLNLGTTTAAKFTGTLGPTE